MLDIDHDIDIPPAPDAEAVYRYDAMKVGDSVFIPKAVRPARTVRKYYHRRSRRDPQGRRFTVRVADGGVRVWRVS